MATGDITTSTALLDEIARRAGVSSRTAYRVLNGEGGKGQRCDAVARAARIHAVAHELGYRPNQAARAMRVGRFATAALLLGRGESTSTLAHGLLAGVHDQLADEGMHLTLARMTDEQLSDQRYLPGALRELMLDGLLLYYTHGEPPELEALLERFRIPTIWINNARLQDAVYPDDEAGARLATEQLLALGHRRIAWWSFSAEEGHYSMAARRAGYRATMRAAGLEPEIRQQPLQAQQLDRPGDDHLAVARAWLTGERPTAVLGQSGKVGLVAAIAAFSLGLRIPEDLSVSFTDQSLDDVGGLGLSRCWCAASTMGRTAVRELVARIAAPDRPRSAVVIPYQYFAGRSCAPPGAA